MFFYLNSVCNIYILIQIPSCQFQIMITQDVNVHLWTVIEVKINKVKLADRFTDGLLSSILQICNSALSEAVTECKEQMVVLE